MPALRGAREEGARRRVEKALRAVPGVEAVEVSLENKQATVTGDAADQALMDAVTDAGYQANGVEEA